MSKDHDVEKLKTDLETLIQDCKNIFGNLFGSLTDSVKDGIKDNLQDKKEKYGNQLHDLKEKIKDEVSKPGTVQYVGAAFVVGIIVGALIAKKKDE